MIDLVPRSVWSMPGPLGPAKVKLPCRGLWLHHAAGSFTDDRDLTVHDDVFADARSVARTGIGRFGRASYSWFTSPASPRGQVLEMQGHWIGAHTANQNSISEALCVMGNFQIIEPSDDLLWTIAATSAHGFLQGWWSQPELLGGHRDAPGAATACPGSHLHDAIPDINRLARELAKEDDPMGWIEDKYPEWAWPWARSAAKRGVINKHTDPNKKVSELTTLELLIHLDAAPDGVRGKWG